MMWRSDVGPARTAFDARFAVNGGSRPALQFLRRRCDARPYQRGLSRGVEEIGEKPLSPPELYVAKAKLL
jgi:hypothetical protein